MKFYLAGRYEDLPLLRDVAFLLIQAGHIVTSRWLLKEMPAPMTPEEFTTVAEEDLMDIRAADHFVLYSHLTPPLPTRQGHSTELGYALGLNAGCSTGGNQVKICIVGVRTLNVFHHSTDVRLFESWQAFFLEYAVPGVLLHGGPHGAPERL